MKGNRPVCTVTFCLLLCLLFYYPASADTLTGRVVAIADGDTLTLLDARNTQHKIRLSGIDAPERGQPYGTVSGDNLGTLVHGQHVTIEYGKLDRYGRIVGQVLLKGRDVNRKQIDDGLAWHYKEYQYEQSAADRAAYAQAEQLARARRGGLWLEPNPIPPWDWRKGERIGSPLVTTPSIFDGSCATERTCGTFKTCSDARAYLQRCGNTGIDGDSDGVPCETMCL